MKGASCAFEDGFMLILVCTHCSTRHQLVVIPPKPRDDAEFRIGAGNCVDCDGLEFSALNSINNDEWRDDPYLYIGPEVVDEQYCRQIKAHYYVGRAVGPGDDCIVTVTGDLQSVVVGEHPNEADADNGDQISLIGWGEGDPCTFTRGSSDSLRNALSFTDELKRFGLSSILDCPSAAGLPTGGKSVALKRAVGYALIIPLIAKGNDRLAKRPGVAREIDTAKQIAFLTVIEGDQRITVVDGDGSECLNIRIRESNGIIDDSFDEIVRGLQSLASLQLELFVGDHDREVIERATHALVGKTGISVDLPNMSDLCTLVHSTSNRDEYIWVNDFARYDNDPVAPARAWRYAAGEDQAHPIIFIDIDGALLPQRAYVAGNNIDVLLRFREDQKFDIHNFPAFDPVAVGLLNRLAKLSDAQFVVSSNWLTRLPSNYDNVDIRNEALLAFKSHLASQGLDERFHDDWHVAKQYRGSKKSEINNWLYDHPLVVDWITIEDDAWHDERCVNCTLADGLTLEVYQNACQALGVQDEHLNVSLRRYSRTTALHRSMLSSMIF